MTQMVSKTLYDEAMRQLGESRARIAALEAADKGERRERDAAEGMVDEDPKDDGEARFFAFVEGFGKDVARIADALEGIADFVHEGREAVSEAEKAVSESQAAK